MRLGFYRAAALAGAVLAGVSLVGSSLASPAEAPPIEMTAGMLARTGTIIDPEKHPGKALFQSNCASCHEGGMPRAPHRDFLQMLSGQSILAAMNGGPMTEMAASLSQVERKQVAEYLTRTSLDSQPKTIPVAMCRGEAARFDLSKPPAHTGWGYDASRFVPAETAKLSSADVPRLKVKWAFAYPGATRARSQPVIAMGAAFVGSQDGSIYALNLDTGCVRWKTKVAGEVRTGIVVEPWAKGTKPSHHPRLYFGDILGNLYAMDALSGAIVWRIRVEGFS